MITSVGLSRKWVFAEVKIAGGRQGVRSNMKTSVGQKSVKESNTHGINACMLVVKRG